MYTIYVHRLVEAYGHNEHVIDAGGQEDPIGVKSGFVLMYPAGSWMFTHVTPVLQGLHWLPVQEHAPSCGRSVTWRALHGLGSCASLFFWLRPYIPVRSPRSADENLLVLPNTDSTLAEVSFILSQRRRVYTCRGGSRIWKRGGAGDVIGVLAWSVGLKLGTARPKIGGGCASLAPPLDPRLTWIGAPICCERVPNTRRSFGDRRITYACAAPVLLWNSLPVAYRPTYRAQTLAHFN